MPKTGEADYGLPQDFPGLPDVLYRNEGNGRFRDVTASAGVAGSGRGMGVLAADLDGDGRIDWLVANDAQSNAVWRNRGDGTFEDVADQLGLAVNGQGLAEANMGIAFGDTDGDALPDVVITHFFGEHTTLWRGYAGPQGGILYQDQTSEAGLAIDSRPLTGWGMVLADLDLDGHLDLSRPTATSAASRPSSIDTTILPSSGETWGLAASPTSPPAPVRISRSFTWVAAWPAAISTATATSTSSSSTITRRASCSGMNRPARAATLIVKLQGRGANRDAIGTRLIAHVGQRSLVRTIDGGGSYLSSSDPRVHFGLGEATSRRSPGGPLAVGKGGNANPTCRSIQRSSGSRANSP